MTDESANPVQEAWGDFALHVAAAGVSWPGFTEGETLEKARALALAAVAGVFGVLDRANPEHRFSMREAEALEAYRDRLEALGHE